MVASMRYAALRSVLILMAGCAKGVYVPTDENLAPSNGVDANVTAPTDDDAAMPSKDAGPMSAPDANPGTDAGDAAMPMSCPATAPCQSARMISDVKGDQGTQVSTASGKGSEWIAVAITDTGNVFNGDSTLSAKLTLKSPQGSNYDLFVHRPSDSGGNTNAPRDCSVAPISSQNAANDDVVSLSWTDDTNGLGQSAGDGLILSIEVRHVSGSCDGMWTLTVEGNVP